MSRTSIQRLADEAPVAHAKSIFDRLDNSPTPSPTSWPARKPPSVAYDAACAEIEIQAVRNVTTLIKDRARAYCDQPWKLESIAYGLVALQPTDLVRSLRRFIAIATMQAGLGAGTAINLKGALLYGRFARAKAHQREAA